MNNKFLGLVAAVAASYATSYFLRKYNPTVGWTPNINLVKKDTGNA